MARTDRPRSSRTLVAALALLLALLGLAAACSSDSSDGSEGASSDGTASAGDCPFSGTTGPTSGGSAEVAAPDLTGLDLSKQGCIDSIQLDFADGVGEWSVAYASGPVTDASGADVELSGAENLVVTLTGATYKGDTPSSPESLLVVLGLDSQLDYEASDSETPAYVSLGLG